MKLIKKGLLDKDGIYLRCEFCEAEFLIEDRNDLTCFPAMDCFEDSKIDTQYSVTCPSCNQQISLGCVDEERILGRYSFLRGRPDWDNRYKVSFSLEDYQEYVKDHPLW